MVPLGAWRTTSRRVVEGEGVGKMLSPPFTGSHTIVPLARILRERELIAVRRYLENTELCRRRWLLDHFDVKVGTAVQQCCDVCSNTVEAVTSEESGDTGLSCVSEHSTDEDEWG